MAKRKNELDELKQLIEFMKGHNIRKLKTPKFQIEMGRPEDDANLAQQQEIDENVKQAAEFIDDSVLYAQMAGLTPEQAVARLSPQDRAKLAAMATPEQKIKANRIVAGLPDAKNVEVKNDSRRNRKERGRKVR
ncbi:MAG: hypothetical protein ABII09_05135 [Planctomycetota bacterium]